MTQTYSERSEAELIRHTLGGDRSAFGSLVLKYQTSAFNLAYRMMGNRQDAEDMAQEAFLAAYCHLDSYDGRRPFKTWLLSIVHHRCVDGLRRRKQDSPLGEQQGRTPDVEERVVTNEQARIVQEALQLLPPADRAAVTLRYWEGMSYREMAEVLGVTEGSVRNRLYRARRFLAEHLDLA